MAISDYHEKHKNVSLTDRVEDLYRPESLDTTGKVTAYWLRSVNPNAVKIAALCLDEQASHGNEDALNAALTVTYNILDLYDETIPILLQLPNNHRARIAYEHAAKFYEMLKKAFLDNRGYIFRIINNELPEAIAFQISLIERKFNCLVS